MPMDLRHWPLPMPGKEARVSAPLLEAGVWGRQPPAETLSSCFSAPLLRGRRGGAPEGTTQGNTIARVSNRGMPSEAAIFFSVSERAPEVH